MKSSTVFLISIFATLVGSIAHADIYATCLDGAALNGVKNSRKVEIEVSPFVFHYSRYSYMGTSDCSGEPIETKLEHRFKFIGEEMVGKYRNLTLKMPNDERYLNLMQSGDETLLIFSATLPFYKDPKGEWMNQIIGLRRQPEPPLQY